MAYDKEQIIEKALQVIEQENCTKISEVLLFLPISKQTFYDWELDKSDSIRGKIDEVKVRLKQGMKRRWMVSDNPALQIAAFKLIADEEEMEAVTTTKVKNDNTHSFKNKPTINLIVDGGKEHTVNQSGN